MNKNTPQTSLLEDAAALKELVNTIVDYYCFISDIDNKNNNEEDEDEDWKKKISGKYEEIKEQIIPTDLDDLISQAFKSQLKKYIDKK